MTMIAVPTLRPLMLQRTVAPAKPVATTPHTDVAGLDPADFAALAPGAGDRRPLRAGAARSTREALRAYQQPGRRGNHHEAAFRAPFRSEVTMQTSVEFDYGQLDGESRIVVQQRTSELKSLIRRSAQDIIEIGLRLTEVKARLGHGRFGAWLAAEFHWSPDTALNFMRVAERFGQNPNISEFAPSALYLLAAPAASAAACREALARAEAGERISVPVAQAIIREHRPAPPPYAAVWELETGLRSWLARQTSGRAAQPLRAAEQIALLDSICRRTTAGLIAFDDLLAVPDLPEPRRKGDMIQAVNNVLAQLRQAEAGGREQEAEVREEVIGVKDPDPRTLMLVPAATMGTSGGLAVAQVAPATGDLAMGPADPRGRH